MGPPKRRPKRTPHSELVRRWNCFEYRWNAESQSYYLFNPWTGETVFDTTSEITDRRVSMWATPEKFPSDRAKTVNLYPEFYASRRWGRRPFNGWNSEASAATHICAVARGFLARLKLRKIFKERFYTSVDNFSGYLFFVDRNNPEAETTWFKPLLAFPGDIKPLKVEDPEDYMRGNKYSKQDFKIGPFMTVNGLSKEDKARADIDAFLVKSEWRESALREYSEIDLNSASLGSIISWFEGTKATGLYLSQFQLMRTAVATENNWETIKYYMDSYPDDDIIQMYGFYCFSKTNVPIDVSGVLSYIGADVMYSCVDVVKDEENKHTPHLKLFALEAFHNILCVRPGRLEYLNTSNVPEQGELRNAAIEKFLTGRFSIFNRYLTLIPSETISVYAKGAQEAEFVQHPLPRAVEVIESVLKCLCALATEIETKEQLAFSIVQPLIFTLGICMEEAYVILRGLQLLYNLCYRCESGQEAVLTFMDTQDFFGKVHHHHSGDVDVMYQCRRLELSLKQDGWRGNVESLITMEMNNEIIDEEYLKVSEYERK